MVDGKLSKKDEIYDRVIDALVHARYRFGDRIFVKEIGAETGASRQPIMTALARLAADGFVRIIPQVGCEVVSPDRTAIADFYMMFARMEGLLAELAAQRRSDRQLRDLRSLHARIVAFEHAHDDAEDFAALNRAFHLIVHLMAGSPLVDQLQRRNFNMSDFFIAQSGGFEGFLPDSVREHEGMIAAIADRQPARARRLAEDHIDAVARSVLRGIEQVAPTTAASSAA